MSLITNIHFYKFYILNYKFELIMKIKNNKQLIIIIHIFKYNVK